MGPALQSSESRAGWRKEAQCQSVGKAGPLDPPVSLGAARAPEVEDYPLPQKAWGLPNSALPLPPRSGQRLRVHTCEGRSCTGTLGGPGCPESPCEALGLPLGASPEKVGATGGSSRPSWIKERPAHEICSQTCGICHLKVPPSVLGQLTCVLRGHFQGGQGRGWPRSQEAGCC